jgi:hydrocephalus-inducing protein
VCVCLQGSATVPFRNVFAVEAEFVYSTDNPAFVLARSSEKLPPKKPSSISVSYRPSSAHQQAAAGGGSSSSSRMAKLTVACPKQTSTQWVFYLQA